MYRSLSLLILFASGVYAQSVINCVASANPPVVRAEGIAERTGDVAFSCSGGQPNSTITGNLVLFLSVNVTNKVAVDGTADVILTVNNVPANVPARVTGANQVTWNGLAIPLNAEGKVELGLQNLRGNASELVNIPGRVITLYGSFTGGSLLIITNNQFTVGVPLRALLAASTGRLICTQAGSPLPSALTLASFVAAGSTFTTTRVTEGFATAFAPRSDWSNLNADSGVRIIQRFSGFTANARLFVPDFIAGSDADQLTSAGALGFPASGGVYTPGQGQLLLVRVTGANANGAGGTFAATPPTTGPVALGTVSEVSLTNGAGYVVYEVADASPTVRESAQLPAFLALTPGGGTAVTEKSVNLAPVSTVFTASAAPIPRFISIVPQQDCTVLGDCNASYFPRLVVDSAGLQLNSASATGYIPVRNSGSGVLQWTATTTGSFLRIAPPEGVNNGTVRVDALATGLQPGTYTANIVVDAGPLSGTRTVPVTFTVGTAPPQSQAPAVRAVANAADGTILTVSPGSLASVFGSRFGGSTVAVTFDGLPARVLFVNDTQVNVQVPAALQGKTSARIIVSSDGNASAPYQVDVVNAAPAIFPGAVLNQDFAVNTEAQPATSGSVLQIFGTGLPATGVITARVHDRVISVLEYAGDAPGLPGVQQVNVRIPADLPAMQTFVYICAGDVCSPAQKLWLR
jgi:uncharacterized protein (TIGR03437 family)